MIQISKFQELLVHRKQSDFSSVVAIGNFDGMHVGHQKLVEFIASKSKELSAKSLAFTFAPHPRIFFGALEANELLFTENEKNLALESLGIDIHLAQEFDKDFQSLTPEEFVETVLIKALNASYVVIGDNFKFGHNRKGNSEWLKETLKEKGIGCKVISDILHTDSNTISSTAIRSEIEAGNIEKANCLLGYSYSIKSIVDKGNQQGTSLGFSTANIKELPKKSPGKGVYVTLTKLDSGVVYQSVTNCGTRPTITNDKQITIESHLLVESEVPALYGKTMRVYFLARLRDEVKFDNKEQLQKQVAADIAAAKKYFLNNQPIVGRYGI